MLNIPWTFSHTLSFLSITALLSHLQYPLILHNLKMFLFWAKGRSCLVILSELTIKRHPISSYLVSANRGDGENELVGPLFFFFPLQGGWGTAHTCSRTIILPALLPPFIYLCGMGLWSFNGSSLPSVLANMRAGVWDMGQPMQMKKGRLSFILHSMFPRNSVLFCPYLFGVACPLFLFCFYFSPGNHIPG